MDRFTPVYFDLAHRTLRPDTWVVREATVTDKNGRTRKSKAPSPLRLLQFAAGQEKEVLLWETRHACWERSREIMRRAWNCVPQGAYVPRPICHFAGTHQVCIQDSAEFWPYFVANLLRDSGKLLARSKFPDYCAEVAFLTIGVFQASLLAIEKAAGKAEGTHELHQGSDEEERLIFDRLTKCITLDGISHSLTNPKAFTVFRTIATSNGPITRADISKQVSGTKGAKTIRRLLNSLPHPLLRTIQSGPQGYCLVLPPRTRKKGRT
jgi:hypothetical protein